MREDEFRARRLMDDREDGVTYPTPHDHGQTSVRMTYTAVFVDGPLKNTQREMQYPLMDIHVPVLGDVKPWPINEHEPIGVAIDRVVYEKYYRSLVPHRYFFRVRHPKPKPADAQLAYLKQIKGSLSNVTTKLNQVWPVGMPRYAVNHLNMVTTMLKQIDIELDYAKAAIEGGR